MSARLNIGLIGSGFMGQAHADAYRRAAMFYPDLPKRPHLYALADQDQAMAERHAAKLGAEKAYGDWRELVNDPQVDVVDITSPNHLHYTMAMAAIAAGKHVYCEKPLAVNEQQAQEMAQAARRAGVKTMVAFNNIKTPAALLAKQIIARGDIGEPVRFRGTFDQGFYNEATAPVNTVVARPRRPYPVRRPVFAGRDPRSDRQRANLPAPASGTADRCRVCQPGRGRCRVAGSGK